MTTISRGIRLVSLASRPHLALVALAVAPLVMGCGLLGKKGGDVADAEAEAAVAEVAEAAPPPAATPAATNENDVSRFPDEKKLDNVTGTIQRPTNVREIPGIGKVVAALAKGGTVTEIASRGTFFLVVFTNPADQKSLMGWINQDSFTAPATVAVKPLACVLPETPLFSDGPFCGKICVNDVDCPSGQACKGHANKFVAAKLGDAVGVCTVFTPAKPVAPAVAVPIAPTTPTTAPAAAPPAPAANVNVVPPVGGKCPAGFKLFINDRQCHRG